MTLLAHPRRRSILPPRLLEHREQIADRSRRCGNPKARDPSSHASAASSNRYRSPPGGGLKSDVQTPHSVRCSHARSDEVPVPAIGSNDHREDDSTGLRPASNGQRSGPYGVNDMVRGPSQLRCDHLRFAFIPVTERDAPPSREQGGIRRRLCPGVRSPALASGCCRRRHSSAPATRCRVPPQHQRRSLQWSDFMWPISGSMDWRLCAALLLLGQTCSGPDE